MNSLAQNLGVYDTDPQNVSNLLDCVNRPFDLHENVKIPDGNPNHTLQLTDYYEDNALTTPDLQTSNSVSVRAIGMCITYGASTLTIQSRTYNNGADSSTYMPYSFALFVIDNTNRISPWAGSAGLGTSYFYPISPVNQATIVGSNVSINTNDALVSGLRLISAGMRMWPTIELITNSETVAISKFYGCQMTLDELYKCASDGNDFFSTIANSNEYSEFTNSEGISGRFQPCQQGSVIDPLRLSPLGNLNSPYMVTGAYYSPVIVARLTFDQLVDGDDPDSIRYSFPARFYGRFIFEGSLSQPTPIHATKCAYVPEWRHALEYFTFRNDLYPTIVKGHSFKKISQNLADLSYNIGLNKKIVASTKQMINSMMNKALKPQNDKKKKKKKKKKTNKKNNNNNNSLRILSNTIR